jgi:hypothetical protein
MAMSKKDFIALADMLRTARMNVIKDEDGYPLSAPYSHNPFRDEHIQFLADFCETQNRNFKRQRWLDYIAGKCGSNGGAIRKDRVA